jgi:hypothetical protein
LPSGIADAEQVDARRTGDRGMTIDIQPTAIAEVKLLVPTKLADQRVAANS